MAATLRLSIQQALSQAEKVAKKGDVDFAKQLYAAVLQKHPNHMLAEKRLRELEKGSQRKKARPTDQTEPSPDQMNAIFRLYDSGEMGKAEQACKKMLALFPQASTVYSVLGATLISQGKTEQALKVYDKAIQLKPDYLDAYYNRGIALQNLGQVEEAIESYDKVIELNPDYAQAHNNRGNAFIDLGHIVGAVKCYDQAIQLNPDYAEAYNNLGNAHKELGQLEEAIKKYDKAVQLKPDYAEAYYNRGIALNEFDRLEDAIKSYDRAIEIKPDYAEPYHNRGIALKELGKVEEAIKSYDHAIQFKPDFVKAYNNHGLALQDCGRLEEAIKSYEQALQISPKYYSARYNRSLAWLLGGKLQQAWPEYEFRFKAFEDQKRTFRKGIQWKGEPLEDKLVFVYPEQGTGDIIQFMRYLPLIKKLGGKVIFEVRQPLVRLVETFKGYDKLWTHKQNRDLSSINRFDYHVAIMSLPGLFNTTLENIPSASPYLSADNKLLRMWQTRLASKELFKVGIVWAGAGGHKKDHMRSIRLSDFKVLKDIKGLKLFSLQKEKHAKWTDIDPGEVVDIDLGAKIIDFADTAAIIENLDLVVSVDTSVVHLAGALGKEVWTLLPYSPDWRWMLNRNDSPWYPSMRLFRQPSPCDWKSVLQAVRKALIKRSAVTGKKVLP